MPRGYLPIGIDNMTAGREGNFYLDSASLATLREFIATMYSLGKVLNNAIQLRIVLDSNVILGDLIWLCKGRVKPGAKTSIQELVTSKTLIPYAPSVARQEVDRALPNIADKYKIEVDVLLEAWADYQKALIFCDVTVEAREHHGQVRDPTDLPFIQLAKDIGAAGIATKDKDIEAMGGNRIHLDCVIQLRDYSRAKNIELSIQVGGVVLAMVVASLVAGVVKGLQAIISAIVRLPPWIQVLLICGVLAAVAHPRSRQAIQSAISELSARVRTGAAGLKDPMIRAMDAVSEAQGKAEVALAGVQVNLRADRRTPLRVHVYAICAAAGEPLHLVEIERRVLLAGYKTKSKSLRKYLLKLLHQDKRLFLREDGHWAITRTGEKL
jgi:predicted nucleic acid-binding protein